MKIYGGFRWVEVKTDVGENMATEALFNFSNINLQLVKSFIIEPYKLYGNSIYLLEEFFTI